MPTLRTYSSFCRRLVAILIVCDSVARCVDLTSGARQLGRDASLVGVCEGCWVCCLVGKERLMHQILYGFSCIEVESVQKQH